MSEPGNKDDMREDAGRVDMPVDPYTTESSADIYATPAVSMDTTDVVVDSASRDVAVTDTHGLFSGSGQQSAAPYDQGAYQGNPYNVDSAYGSSPYDTNNPYGVGSGYAPDSTYGAGSGYAPGNTYGQGNGYTPDNAYGQGNGYAPDSTYGQGGGYTPDNTYGAGNPYNAGTPYGPGGAYGANTYGESGYGSPYNGANPYGGQQAGGGYGGQPPYNTPPFQDNPYSPYAAPQKKSHTGLIITIVVVVIILFILAVCALAYRAVELIDKSDVMDEFKNGGKYEFDDDYEYDYDDDYFYDDDYDYDEDYFYGGDYDYDYENDKYYSLHDDLKYDLSYQVEFDFFEYETDNENVSIMVTYPIVVGEDVQNLDRINDALYSEVELLTEYFEEDYAPYMNNEDGYFSATAVCYVTYMDEDKLSVAFQERIYADFYDMAYLECFNIDMENGVILDNQEMLSIDDDFSVEFRTRSDEQNGEIYSLTNMTDQEITGYFNSPDVIVFYTPKGMEIGFNYEDGWVTVTYEEYEQYLNVF